MKKLSAERQKEWERLVSAADEALANCAAFRDELVEEMESFYEEKSEKWQEGEKGQEFEQWKASWEEFDFADITDNLNALPLTAEDA